MLLNERSADTTTRYERARSAGRHFSSTRGARRANPYVAPSSGKIGSGLPGRRRGARRPVSVTLVTIFSFRTTSPPRGLTIFAEPMSTATLVDRSGRVRTAMRVFTPGPPPGTLRIVTCRAADAAWIALSRSGAGFEARLSRKSDDRRAREI